MYVAMILKDGRKGCRGLFQALSLHLSGKTQDAYWNVIHHTWSTTGIRTTDLQNVRPVTTVPIRYGGNAWSFTSISLHAFIPWLSGRGTKCKFSDASNQHKTEAYEGVKVRVYEF